MPVSDYEVPESADAERFAKMLSSRLSRLSATVSPDVWLAPNEQNKIGAFIIVLDIRPEFRGVIDPQEEDYRQEMRVLDAVEKATYRPDDALNDGFWWDDLQLGTEASGEHTAFCRYLDSDHLAEALAAVRDIPPLSVHVLPANLDVVGLHDRLFSSRALAA